MRTKIYLVRIEPMIDKLHFNLFFIVSNDLLCFYISRTCFKPIQDYIDIYDYMNMIEAIGWATKFLKSQPFAYEPLVNLYWA